MPNQELAGNLLLVTEPSDPAKALSVSRTDGGTTNTLTQISMSGDGVNKLQGVLTFSTMNTGEPNGPLDERMRIHTNGNVGIGTNAPSQKLEVAGTVKAAAFQGDGSGLTAVQDQTRVSRSGDTMTGALNLPANGLVVGASQLAVKSGNIGIGTASPVEKLEVRGTIKLHPDGSLYAPGSGENLRIVRGTVLPAGKIAGGTGFGVAHVAKGIYEVTFQQHFAGIPTVVATQHYPDGNDFSNNGGSTRDNCVIIAVSEAKTRIKCGDGNGNPSDRRFEFIALGPR